MGVSDAIMHLAQPGGVGISEFKTPKNNSFSVMINPNSVILFGEFFLKDNENEALVSKCVAHVIHVISFK